MHTLVVLRRLRAPYWLCWFSPNRLRGLLSHLFPIVAITLALAGSVAAIFTTTPAHAAIGAESCTGFVNTLPFTISTQGTWCFRADLATSMTSGEAITINANNVTLDCLDYKLGGLGAGPGTFATGIYALSRFNVTVRNCNIRGFVFGVNFVGLDGGGHVVENNRFDKNTAIGIAVDGNGSVVRRNRVSSTGASTVSSESFGIFASGSVDVIDNTISGVTGLLNSHGILIGMSNDGQIKGNRVRGVVKVGAGVAYGINMFSSTNCITLRNNDLVGDGSAGSIGLYSSDMIVRKVAIGNVVKGFETGMSGVIKDASNVVLP